MGIERFSFPPYIDELPEFMLREARIPKMHWGAELEKMAHDVDEGVVSTIVEYMNPETMVNNVRGGIGLAFQGPFGTGKTSAACIIAKEVLRRRGTAMLVRADEIPGMHQIMHDSDNTLMDMARSVDLLVIDDLYAEFESDKSKWSSSQMEMLVRSRREECRATLVTTNVRVQSEKMKKKYGERFQQSLLRMVTVEMVNSSQREQVKLPPRIGRATKKAGE